MVKICVNSPEVMMQGDISIHAQVSIVTKAKLDNVAVAGRCSCDDLPPPPKPQPKVTDVDIVFLVDGSDSFDRTKIHGKTELSGTKEEQTQFSECMKWCGDYIQNTLGAAWSGKATATVVQFSGIKALESSYTPDTDGDAFADDSFPELKHYSIEHGPVMITADGDSEDVIGKLGAVDALDGNSQIFLAMQDICSHKFLERLQAVMPDHEGRERKRILVTITDEEWDVRDLASGDSLNESLTEETDEISRRVSTTGRINRSSRITVPQRAAMVYNEMYAIIVRPNSEMTHLNEEFIVEHLCKQNSQNYFKVYANDFFPGMERARKAISRLMNAY